MRLKEYISFVIVLIGIVISLYSCKDEQVSSSNEIAFPDSNISFSKHVSPLFQQKCAYALCHSGENPAGNLNLEYNSYSSIMNKTGLVIPYNANNSILIQRIEGTLPPQMPPPKSPQLNINQINGIKKWINEGALNN